MKTHPILPLFASCLALAGHAVAIEAPEDNAPPPADAIEKPAQPKIPFLGVITEPVPDLLKEHLGLKDQAGVVVRSVIPDGPAAKAGIQIHDIITGIAGRKVESPETLTEEIRKRAPGDEISARVIQQGKEHELKLSLAARPDNLALDDPQPMLEEKLHLNGMPDEFADRIRKMIEGNVGGIEIAPLGQPEEQLRKIPEQMKRAMKLQIEGMNGGVEIKRGATFRMMDNQGSVELRSENDSKEVTVRDKDNNIVWSGPWDTEQDKASAPKDVRDRIDALNIDGKGNGFQLRLGPFMPGE